MDSNPLPRAGMLMVALMTGVVCILGLGIVLVAATGQSPASNACAAMQTVGATEYGGPGDPSSGTRGSSGVDLLTHPDSYAELGGSSFQSATALGGLPYGTPLLIAWRGHAMVAYKRDIGLGGGPIAGHPRVIDLWWQFAHRLGIPYEDGRWSGTVQISAISPACGAGQGTGLQLVTGLRAQLLPDGQAAAPEGAPAAVAGIIAAGNQIAGEPYLYGGGHGTPLDQISPTYDCSSSVARLLWGGGLLSPGGDMTSGQFEHWGLPGPGRWVTIYASASHVFMYVAGLRWDTWNAAGAGDGSAGIGWHPLVRGDAGFVVRHPPGL